MEKRLHRSRDKKVVAGIAGGLGDYLDIDPVIIRIVIVLITIFHGVGLIVYIIMWIVIPEEPYNLSYTEGKADPTQSMGSSGPASDQKLNDESAKNSNEKEKSSNGRIIVGVILILIGIMFLSERFLPFFDFEFVFAIGLIFLGFSLLFNMFNKSEKSS